MGVLSPGDPYVLNVLVELSVLQLKPSISCPSGLSLREQFFFSFLYYFLAFKDFSRLPSP